MLSIRDSVLFYLFCCFVMSFCHPTVYRMKGNRVLEPDLVPVSSTVIPLPSYELGYGFNITQDIKHHKKFPYYRYNQSSKIIADDDKKKYYYGQKKHDIDKKSQATS